MLEKPGGIKIGFKNKVFIFSQYSEILKTKFIFSLCEPYFCEQSAKIILNRRNTELVFCDNVNGEINPLSRIKKVRVFRDKNNKKKLILDLIY